MCLFYVSLLPHIDPSVCSVLDLKSAVLLLPHLEESRMKGSVSCPAFKTPTLAVA